MHILKQKSLANANRRATALEYRTQVTQLTKIGPHLGSPSNINVIYTSLKSTFSAQQSVADNAGLFIRLAVVASPKCHGHPRSVILVPIERAYASSY